MDLQQHFDVYMDALINGNRRQAREVIRNVMRAGVKPLTIYHHLLWPALTAVQQGHRNETITTATHNLAIRINRFLADQVQAQLVQCEPNGKRLLVLCAPDEPEELGAQMATDLCEADGWEVFFIGSSVPDDEVIELVGRMRPNILLIFGSRPSAVPDVRHLIEHIRDVGACPMMNIMLSGGIFNRVPGLWEEINADLYAESPIDVATTAADAKPKLHPPRVSEAPRKRRRRTKAAVATADAAN